MRSLELRTLLTLAAAAAVGCVSLVGCAQKLDAKGVPAGVDPIYFECKVQPILTKSCSMFLCHGSGDRYLRIYARNRLRYGGDEDTRNSPLTPDELHRNYLAARAMVAFGHPEKSLLVMKPLDQKIGGYFHRGATLFGKGNVFTDAKDPDYAVLQKWVKGTSWQDDPQCKVRFAALLDAGTIDSATSGDAGL